MSIVCKSFNTELGNVKRIFNSFLSHYLSSQGQTRKRAGKQKSPWDAINFSKCLSKHLQGPRSEKANSCPWYYMEWVFGVCPGYPICFTSIKPKKSPPIYTLSLSETHLMGYGFTDRVAVSFPTVLPQKPMEMFFRRRGLIGLQLETLSHCLQNRCLFILACRAGEGREIYNGSSKRAL